ncbi:MAG: NAD(P)H-hydrate dehydratase [Candidatus Methanospirareceae archaeon]
MIGREEITSEEMAALDENCDFFGLSRLQLMENAGASIAREIKKRFGKGESITIVAGKGNNGGDAFVAARHLQGEYDIKVLLLGASKDIRTEEARRNFEILKRGEYGYEIKEIRDSSELRMNEGVIKKAKVVIDAIFGTGIRGRIREPEATAIDLINEAKERNNAFVISVDVPSGLDPDTGVGTGDKVVKANLTVTFHKMKRGLKREEAREYVGVVEVASIGIPGAMEMLAGPGDVRMIMRRNASSHKGENGRVLVVGGGPFFGAPALTALAALRAGADWVTIATPKRAFPITSSFSPNLIAQPLSSEVLTKDDVKTVLELAKRHDVIVIGMGLGDREETVEATRAIIENEVCKRVVVDADGFYGLSLPNEDMEKKMIITPHVGELRKIKVKGAPVRIEKGKMERMGDKIEFVRAFSKENNVVTLLKGRVDIISDGECVKINNTGNAGMTVGGTGDVLAGVTGAFLAVSEDPLKAATAAAFVTGTAGDLALKDKGYGLLATDIIENIPRVIREMR